MSANSNVPAHSLPPFALKESVIAPVERIMGSLEQVTHFVSGGWGVEEGGLLYGG